VSVHKQVNDCVGEARFFKRRHGHACLHDDQKRITIYEYRLTFSLQIFKTIIKFRKCMSLLITVLCSALTNLHLFKLYYRFFSDATIIMANKDFQ